MSVYIVILFLSLWRNSPTRAGRLIVEISISHTIRHTHTHNQPVSLLWTSDQFVAGFATCTTHNKQKI